MINAEVLQREKNSNDKYAREVCPEFDFAKQKATVGRYSIHDYPAMLHYLLVRHLINKYSSENDTVYDPFCGSGVSIVEGLRLNRKAIGSDINPLALLVADVRASNFEISKIEEQLNNLKNGWDKLSIDIPEVKNISFWFKEYVTKDLGKIRSFLPTIKDEKILKFFLIVFSQAVKNVSNNRKGEFKRYRLSPEKLKSFNPDVKDIFFSLADQYLRIIKEDAIPCSNFELLLKDAREPTLINDVDLIITSPPYGDSRTTVAYGQFSSFSFEWLRGLNPYGDADLKFDSFCLGGKKNKEMKSLPSETLHKTLDKISKKDEKRAKEVFSFFYDYYLSIKQIVRTLKKNAYVCFVVGNRTVKGVQIEMDFITVEFFESLGLTFENIFVRNISNKRMPSKNSPSNKTGKTLNTMLNEYIVVMKR